MNGVRIAVMLFAVLLPAIGHAQTPAPATPQPDILKELLTEVRGLRQAMERAATVGARIQLLVARVQMQETRITELSKRLVSVREELSHLDVNIAGVAEQAKRFDESIAGGRLPADEARGLEGQIEMFKQQIASETKRRNDLANEESMLSQQISTDQGRWSDVSGQLDELERSLAPRKQ